MMTTSFSALLNFNVFNSHVFTRLQAKQRNQLFGAKTNGPPMASAATPPASSNCINVGIFMYTLLWTYGMVIVAVTVCNDLDRQTK